MHCAKKFLLQPTLIALLLAAPLLLISADQEPESGPAPQSTEQIQALVAPIALYPDALVAQVLSASTFPDQVALAQNWLAEHKDLSGKKLVKEVDKESWDPSVKALTQFPSVLDNMAKNLAWTSELGQVYHHQPKDVMEAVQGLRAKAKADGHLTSNQQIKVVQKTPSTIVIDPANPQIVYVPQYNPTVIFGTSLVTPGYTPAEVAATSAISFGAGIAVGALMSSGSSWGWNAWGCDWHGGVVAFGGAPYFGNAAWHGAYGAYGYRGYGGYGAAAYRGPGGAAAGYHGYSANGVYHTGGAYANGWGAGAAHTSYGPDGAIHTSGTGYNSLTGQSYHYGASKTPLGGTAYHGTNSMGQHAFGGTTAGGKSWGGGSWARSDGWGSRAASDRGWGSLRSGGFGGGRFGGFGGGHFGGFHGFRR